MTYIIARVTKKQQTFFFKVEPFPCSQKIYSKNKNISKLDNKSLFIWLMGNEDKNILIIICQLLEVLNINRNTILN